MEHEKNIHNGHFKRLREQFLKHPESFNDHQILELLLSYISIRKDVNPLAHNLTSFFGSVKNVCYATKKDLMKVDGITERMADYINLFPKLVEIYEESLVFEYKKIFSQKEMIREIKNFAQNPNPDLVYILGLSFDNCLISKNVYNKLPDNVPLIKECANLLLQSDCVKLVMANYSDKSEYTPTINDILETKAIYIALRNLNMKLEDRIIFYNNGFYSFKDSSVIRIIAAVIYGENNIFLPLIKSPHTHMMIMQKASEINDPLMSEDDKIIITVCQYSFNLLMQDLFV